MSMSRRVSGSSGDDERAWPTIAEIIGQALGTLLATILVDVVRELTQWLGN